MPDQNNNRQSNVYDDALPESLLFKGVLDRQTDALSLKTGADAPLSPYIIHLSRGEDPVVAGPGPHLDALAKELLEQNVLPAASAPGEPDDLTIHPEDLARQLRQPERQTKQPTLSYKHPRAHRPSKMPSTAPLAGNAPNLYELVEETEKEAGGRVRISYVRSEAQTAPAETGSAAKQPERFFKIPSFSFAALSASRRALAAFVFLSFAVVLPLHAMQGPASVKSKAANINTSGENAIDEFNRAASALKSNRFDVAGNDFARASRHFSEAQNSLQSLNASVAALANLLPQTDRTYESVRGLVTAGKELSDAAQTLTRAAEDVKSQSSLNIVTKLSILSAYIQDARPNVEAAARSLERVDPSVVPKEHAGTVKDLKRTAPKLAASMNEFIEFSDTLALMLGDGQKMRYLVTFQNNTELRPTGGFIGSFAEMDLLNGDIDNIHIPEGGTYDLQGQLGAFVASPKPLSLINPRWEFHDANWFPDFPTSAKKMIWFYEKAGGPTVDGVLAINATMMPKLLEVLGPVEMPEYGRVINSENFLFETQKIVEVEYDQYEKNDPERTEEAPKQFIGDLAPKILEKLEQADMPTLLSVLDILGSGLNQKDVILYFQENELQSRINALGWSGALKQAPDDYLMITHTNLGGYKTDTVIEQDVTLDADVQPDGSVINTVTIRKTHRGLKTELFEGRNNVDYIRLYVPQGSELMDAEGFEIPPVELFEASDAPLDYDEDLALLMQNVRKHTMSKTDVWEESGKTVFGNWMQTAPGEVQTVSFRYRLPFFLTKKTNGKNLLEQAKTRLGLKKLEPYTILIQKQPGVETRETTVNLTLPDSMEILWSSHHGTAPGENILVSNEEDAFLRFLAEHLP